MIERIKTWLIVAGGAILSAIGIALTFWLKGRKSGKEAGQVARAKQKVQAAQEASDTYLDALGAEADVTHTMSTLPKPNNAQRNDLDNDW